MSKLQNINKDLQDTRYLVINDKDEPQDIKQNLLKKFDKDKKYGTIYAYFITDDKLGELHNALRDISFKDYTSRRILDKYCEFGFEMLDMSSHDRQINDSKPVILDMISFVKSTTLLIDNTVGATINEAIKLLEDSQNNNFKYQKGDII